MFCPQEQNKDWNCPVTFYDPEKGKGDKDNMNAVPDTNDGPEPHWMTRGSCACDRKSLGVIDDAGQKIND